MSHISTGVRDTSIQSKTLNLDRAMLLGNIPHSPAHKTQPSTSYKSVLISSSCASCSILVLTRALRRTQRGSTLSKFNLATTAAEAARASSWLRYLATYSTCRAKKISNLIFRLFLFHTLVRNAIVIYFGMVKKKHPRPQYNLYSFQNRKFSNLQL